MKKLIFSTLAVASLALAANAVTHMCVKTKDGNVVKYDVEHVAELYYSRTDHGVSISGWMDDYTYVDLDLPSGTKWATYNVGATKPTEYGDYFAWGETKQKEEYYYSTYKWGVEGLEYGVWKYRKYNTDSASGIVDNLTTLLPEDDAATANWGSAWRMPTREEQEELRDGCDWVWVEDFNGSGVNGRLGTSKSNGSTIFLPAAGFLLLDAEHSSAGSDGYYLSSSLIVDDKDYSNFAYILDFSEDSFYWSGSDRLSGLSVRAVLR